MAENTFELRKVGLVQAGKNIFWTFGIFAIGCIASLAYDLLEKQTHSVFIHIRNGIIVFAIFYSVKKIFDKKKIKDFAESFVIKIVGMQIIIQLDNEDVYNGDLNSLRAIRTLELSNKKADVQAQIYIENLVFNLSSSLSMSNKIEFDNFVRCCEKRLNMLVKPVPFSIFTHNLQGIKYIEYYNPKNPLVSEKKIA